MSEMEERYLEISPSACSGLWCTYFMSQFCLKFHIDYVEHVLILGLNSHQLVSQSPVHNF